MSNGTGRWGGRRGDHVRAEHNVRELHENALFTGGGADDPLRAACADIHHFFASGRRGGHASAKAGARDGNMAMDRPVIADCDRYSGN